MVPFVAQIYCLVGHLDYHIIFCTLNDINRYAYILQTPVAKLVMSLELIFHMLQCLVSTARCVFFCRNTVTHAVQVVLLLSDLLVISKGPESERLNV